MPNNKKRLKLKNKKKTEKGSYIRLTLTDMFEDDKFENGEIVFRSNAFKRFSNSISYLKNLPKVK